MTRIKAPVYGFYAGDDARIGATVPGAIEAMKAAGKTYEPVTYDGAGHGFMRAGEAPDATDANKKRGRSLGHDGRRYWGNEEAVMHQVTTSCGVGSRIVVAC